MSTLVEEAREAAKCLRDTDPVWGWIADLLERLAEENETLGIDREHFGTERDAEREARERAEKDAGEAWSLVEHLADTLETVLPYISVDTYEKTAAKAIDEARASLGQS